MSKTKIAINDLKVGMYIIDLDISWLDSPFLRHKFVIRHLDEIKELKQAGARIVTIDLSKSKIESQASNDAGEIVSTENQSSPEHEKQADEEPSADSASAANTEKVEAQKDPPPRPSSPSLSEEIEQVNSLRSKAQETFNNLNNAIINNEIIDESELVPVVDNTIESLTRNNQALVTMMHLKRHDKELFTHSFSVMALALSLAIKLDFNEQELHDLGVASLLHDLGWAKLPLHLLGKTKSYTNDEFTLVEKHVSILAKQLLQNPEFNHQIVTIIAQHHERCDGGGYPLGKTAEQLSQSSKLLAIIDYYDELVHGLLDGPGMIPSQALRKLFIEAEKGRFDCYIVQRLISLLGIYPVTSAVLLNSGEKAVVVELNDGSPLKPVVKIFYDQSGQALAEPLSIDLVKDENDRKISSPIDSNDKKNDPLQLLSIDKLQNMV